MGVLSTSSVQIGTGAKTFTVPAGLGWSANDGIRIRHVQDRHKWMRGTVTSYSGTTLVIDSTATSGHTDTLAFWTVGQTSFYRSGSSQFFTSSGANPTAGLTDITSSPSAGATSFTVSDGSGLYVYPTLGKITILPATNDESYNLGAYLRGMHTTYVWVTNVSGNTVTVGTPLIVGLPSGRTPKITIAEFGAREVGFENFAAFGTGGSTATLISFSGMYSSWLYKVDLGIDQGYQLSLQDSLHCEVAYSYIGGSGDGTSTNNSIIAMGGTTRALIRDSVIEWGFVTEGVPDFNNAFLRNLGIKNVWAANHGSGSMYRLYEHNIASGIHFDGYFGGTKYDTIFRNHFDGNAASLPYGFIIQNRFGRYHNTVGNVIGKTSVTQGFHSLGNPNIGNSDNSGETANSTLYIETSGSSGSLFRHFDGSGQARLTGTLTAKSGTEGTITLTSNTLTDLSTPYSTGDTWLAVVWGTGDSQSSRLVMELNRGASSGSSIVVDDGPLTQGTALPAVSTAVRVHMGPPGAQELDGAVEYSMFISDNYAYAASGASGSITNASGDTLPDSLAETGAPSDWPPSLTWPPPIHPSTPNVSRAVIPAGYYYTNGEWPSDEGGGGGGTTYTPGRLRMLRR